MSWKVYAFFARLLKIRSEVVINIHYEARDGNTYLIRYEGYVNMY